MAALAEADSHLERPSGEMPAMAPARRARRPRAVLGLSLAVAGLLCLPLVFLLVMAVNGGASTTLHLIFRGLTARLLWNTVRLVLAVTAISAVIGTAAAWFTERTDLPGRGVLAVLVVVPLAIPDFVVTFAWASLSGLVEGFKGAVLVMSLAVYPLVYLPVAASFRHADPAQEEVARGLGVGRLRTFVTVSLGQARVAIAGGCLLVALVILAEYGAFEILGYQTFTTEIFTEFRVGFNLPVACALSLVLVLAGLVVLAGDGVLHGAGRSARTGSGAARVLVRQRLGKAKLPVTAGFLLLVALALGVPVGSCLYWMVEARQGTIAGVSMASAAGHTALFGVIAAGLCTLMAVPVATLAVRHGGRAARALERSTFLVLAMPGVVIALALSYFVEHDLGGLLYQQAALLVIAYAILFFPLALVGVRTSLAQVPVAFEEIAHSLGRRRLAVTWRISLPLIGPGLAAAFCLVFLSVVTELTATLILVPTGVQTLSTQFWAYEQNLSYGQAAPFALVMIAISAVPSYVLGRFFDRLPSRSEPRP